jgi:predicted metal-dependent hydrolase
MSQDAITVRKPDLDFSRPIERFYLGGNPVKTHFFNALNLLFPDGERFFVRAVHDHAREIRDPQLLREMRAFAGQEGQHAHQHQRFFEVLARQDYRTQRFLRFHARVVRFGNRLPRALRLAMTAGAEHYTATMAALVFEHDMLSDCDETMRDLIHWHALEEIEHKHVAYDVLMQTHRYNYPLRVLGFGIATLHIALFTLLGMRMLLRQEGRAGRIDRRGFHAARRALSAGKEAAFRKALRGLLVRYLVPGFHPNHKDDRPLLERFTPEVTRLLAAD